MLENITLCSDCDKIMVPYEVYEFCCKRTNVVVGMEEQLCLNCGNKIISTLSLLPLSNYESVISRTESLDISVDDERPEKVLDEDILYNIVINSYRNVFRSICSSRTNLSWYPGYEVDLWKTINGLPSPLKLDNQQVVYVRELCSSIKLWVIDPDSWSSYYGTFDSPFISLKKWKSLFNKYTNQKKE